MQMPKNLADAFLDVRSACLDKPGDTLDKHARKSRHAVAVFRRKIGAAVKRLAVRREKHRHRPAAAPGQHLHGVHVNLIEVGPLFAIDFDADEMLVHQRGDLFVLERLPLHDMAPVTGRVADLQQDRLVLLLAPSKRLVAPRIPIDRIVRVLEKVGAGFVNQSIGMSVFHERSAPSIIGLR